jgi:hypothetical protein
MTMKERLGASLVRRIHALFRTEIRNETRDEITTRRCFILKPYVLVKTNFSLICLRILV